MKSIDKLREVWADVPNKSLCWNCYQQIMDYIDEIEAEIADNYMLLPVDADGVPIHLGDLLVRGNDDKHFCHGIGKPSLDVMDEHCNWWRSECFRHVKPRTLEDVLVDMLEAAVGYSDAHTDVSLVAVEKYADEIRELLGGDAE